MKSTTRYAQIPEIKKGVAFTDPSYGSDVWCQYRKEFQASNWVMKMDAKRDADNYIDIELQIGRGTTLSGLATIDKGNGEFSILHYAHNIPKQTELGMDTACIALTELSNLETYGEAVAIYTATDGLFGEAWEFTCKGEKDPAGFLVMGAVDGGIANEDDLFRTVMAAFDGQEISREKFAQLTNPDSHEVRMELAKAMREENALERNGERKPEKSEPER